MGAQQVALAVLSMALVFLGDGTLGLAVSHQVTPQILALGLTDGHFCAIRCSWDPTSSKDLLWESQIQAEAQFLVPGQLCTALVHSVVCPSNVHMF